MQVNTEPTHGAPISNELRVGVMFLAGMILLLLLIMMLTHWGQDRNTYRFNILFPRADGLTEGATVQVDGVAVGRVCTVGLDPRNQYAIVTACVEHRVNLYHHYKYSVVSNGLVGERYIEITPRRALFVEKLPKDWGIVVRPGEPIDEINKDIAQSGIQLPGDETVIYKSQERTVASPFRMKNGKLELDNVRGESQSDFNDVMKKAELTLDSVNKVIANQDTQENLKVAVANLRLATQSINELITRNQAGVRLIVDNLRDASGEIRRISDAIGPQIEHTDLIKNAELVTKNAVALTARLQHTADSLDCLVCDEKISTQIRTTIDNLSKASIDLAAILKDTRAASGNFPKISDDLAVASAKLPAISDNLSKASANLPTISDNLNKAVANLPEISTNLKAAAADLPKITGPFREIAPDTAKNIHEISVRLNNASASIEGIANTVSKVGGSVTQMHIAPEARVVDIPSASRTVRSDLNLDIRGSSTMLRAGVADLGGAAPVNLQFGNRLGQNAWLRYGVVQSQLGFGLDVPLGNDVNFTGELFNPNNIRGNALIDLRLKTLGPGWWLTSGVWNLFGNNQVGVGLTFRP